MIIFTGCTQKDKVMAIGPRKYLFFKECRKKVNKACTIMNTFDCLKLKLLKGTDLVKMKKSSCNLIVL